MITKTFIIPDILPGLNEILQAKGIYYNPRGDYRKRFSLYASTKEIHENFILLQIKLARIPKISLDDCPIDFVFIWVCPNKKRDKDNIMAGQKFIFDALIKGGIIKNDGWKYVGNIIHKFEINKYNPHIIVVLKFALL